MKIAFDAIPLLGRKSGIGWCEAGQVSALTRMHPEHEYTLNYFAARHLEERKADLAPYLRNNVRTKHAFCVPYAYRTVSTFIPVPYSWFFGKNDLTHFFNYIVPPHVGGRTVVTVHDMVYKAYPETVRGRTKHMLDLGLVPSMKRADCIVTDSEFSRAEIIKYYPEFQEKIRVVPCGVDLEHFHKVSDAVEISRVREKYQIGGDYFLYLGTLEPRKNLVNLITAYAEYAKNFDQPAKLVLAGAKGWLYDEIFAQVESLHLQEHVLFTQYIDSADMCALMSGALAFTFPSLYEGFGMPPLEAMACETPVLVSDAASLPEVTGNSAVIVNATDTQSITQGLCVLHEDENLRKRLSAEGIARAQGFTWEHSAALLYDIYAELLGMTMLAPETPKNYDVPSEIEKLDVPPEIEKRISSVDWQSYSTAYGNAVNSSYEGKYNIPVLLRQLWSPDHKLAEQAASALDAALCHQHVMIDDAAVPAYDILLRRLREIPSDNAGELTEELLWLFDGFAECTSPEFLRNERTKYDGLHKDWDFPDYAKALRQRLLQDRAELTRFAASPNPDTQEAVACLIKDLEEGA